MNNSCGVCGWGILDLSGIQTIMITYHTMLTYAAKFVPTSLFFVPNRRDIFFSP